MKKRCAGFTLLELMAAMLIIMVISGLVLGIYTYINAKANRTRAQAEIAMLGTAISAYATDFGGPPQTAECDSLSPVQHFEPRQYHKASKDLYKALSGDQNAKLNFTEKRYLKELDLKKIVKMNSNLTDVEYLKDPYSYSYGYSTAALKAEQDFKDAVRRDGRSAIRAADPVGFNASGYDLWSTAGNKQMPGTPEAKRLLWMEWIKNW